MEFRLLGRLEVREDDGRPCHVPEGRLRTLCAALLLHAGTVVSAEALARHVWGEALPGRPRAALQVMVARLRKHLGAQGAARIETVRPGYLLTVHPGELDLHRFEELYRAGLAAAEGGRDWERAASLLGQALACWQGELLSDVPGDALAVEAVEVLEGLGEKRRHAQRTRISAELALGRHREAVGELTRLVAAWPLHEDFRGQLMLALYRSGRRSDALVAFQDGRRVLVEELGIEPAAELQALHSAVLADAPELAWHAPPGPLAAPVSAPALAPLPADVLPGPPPDRRSQVRSQVRERVRERVRRLLAVVGTVAVVGALLAADGGAGGAPLSSPDGRIRYVARTGGDAQVLSTTGVDLPVEHPVSSGDTEIVTLMLTSTSAGPVTVTDSAGNAYQQVGDVVDAYWHRTMIFAAFHVRPLNTAALITAAYPRSSKYHIAADEFRGLGAAGRQATASNLRDRQGSAFSTSGAPLDCAAGDLLLTAVGTNSGTAPALVAGWRTLPVLRLSTYRLTTAFRFVNAAQRCAATGRTSAQWEATAVPFH